MNKPRYRYGPDGLREVYDDLPFVRVTLKNGNERMWEEYERLGRTKVTQDNKHPIGRMTLNGDPLRLPPVRFEPFTSERRAEFERYCEKVEHDKNFNWGHDQQYSGAPPGFSVWVNPKIVHVSWIPLCFAHQTACNTKIGRHWHQAVGMLPFEDKRFCLRCQYTMAKSAARAAGVLPRDCPKATDFRRTYEQILGLEL